MRKAKTIDELFEEVKDYDQVLTVDAALAEALNRRVKQPRKGMFASTPRRLACTGDETSKRELFIEALNRTDYSMKQISYSLDKILESWKHTGSLEDILGFEKYDSQLFRDMVGLIEENPTSFHAVESFEADEDLAVVNLFQFNELDKSILKNNYDEYRILEHETAEPEKFNIYSSGLELVKSLKNNISRLGPENVGVVVRPDSRYQSLLESQMNADEIDFTRKETVSEDENLRKFISILNVSLTERRLRVRDVKTLENGLDLEVDGSSNIFLKQSSGELKEFLNAVKHMKLGQALEQVEELQGYEMDQVRGILEELEIIEEPVSSQSLAILEHFLKNYDPSLEEESRGVLLADPRSAAVVDRPVVFLVGMSDEWDDFASKEPWIDEDSLMDQKQREFEIIAQSGDKTVYMVEDQRMDQEINPSMYLEEALNTSIKSFTELNHKHRSLKTKEASENMEKTKIETEKDFKALSQSELNSLVISPRLFYMEQLISDAEEEAMRKGALFHDFAELYFNHPEKARKHLEQIKEIFKKKMREIAEAESIKQIEIEIDIGIDNLMEFIDTSKSYNGDGYTKTDSDNIFAKKLGLKTKDSTEMYFNKNHSKGKVDLIEGDNHLIDFKSGRKKSAKEIVKGSRVETFEDQRFPDFQALMYLSHHSRYVDGAIDFSFVYFLDNVSETLTGEDSESFVTTISYIPEYFDDYVSNSEVFEYLIKDVKASNDRRRTLEAVGYQNFKEFMEKHKFPDIFNEDDLEGSEILEQFKDLCIESKGDYNYVKDAAEQSLTMIIEFRNSRYFKDDIETFRRFLNDKIDELREYEDEGYPSGDQDSIRRMEDLIV